MCVQPQILQIAKLSQHVCKLNNTLEHIDTVQHMATNCHDQSRYNISLMIMVESDILLFRERPLCQQEEEIEENLATCASGHKNRFRILEHLYQKNANCELEMIYRANAQSFFTAVCSTQTRHWPTHPKLFFHKNLIEHLTKSFLTHGLFFCFGAEGANSFCLSFL